ncbi:MAG: DNA mismatch repair protein MutS [Lachnospiraceae bacterium]|nr:DNA mismatch repair protein MutS [Lachnospiraceae bacterium]
MMQHYLATKEQYPDCLLFYRLGDFYEMFFDDAETASRELELTLTGKECGLDERAPMCGVPFHAADSYIDRLVQKGYKVAIAEQMEDPRLAKGLVKREVIRVVTPGTLMDPAALEEGRNNYLMCVVTLDAGFGIAVCDVSTGDFLTTETADLTTLSDEINRFLPAELIANDAFQMCGIDTADLKDRMGISLSFLPDRFFDDAQTRRALEDHFHVLGLAGLGLTDYPLGAVASGALLTYLEETQKTALPHLTGVRTYRTGKFMVLDSATRRNLELTETLREKQKRGSLLWVLDKTKTAMGARMLRRWIEQPLVRKDEIIKRQDAVSQLKESFVTCEELREYLQPVYDLERLLARIGYRSAGPRDLIAFRTSLQMLPHVRRAAQEFDSPLLKEIAEDLDPLEDLEDLIGRAIVDDPPIQMREGGIIRDGYHEEVDLLKKSKTEGKTWLMELETRERESTGIKNLRIRYNKVFGYYLEVTNSFKDLVPAHYIRKQTLTGAERYTTDELKKLEEVILGAEDKLFVLEYDLFCGVRDAIAEQITRVQKTARAVAALDALASLAAVAGRNNYCRPQINDDGHIRIEEGRHPVVEQMLRGELFVANDTYLDRKKDRVAVITGPNMAGKSTYMRQVALITLMAQIGSFVPAKAADIGVFDRIFTRVGASDDLASGQSTFMVEMTEVANILRHATSRSLLILDEIGRGTSTFDGLSIAWAVVEHVADPKLLGAKTLFATHYHELTELEGTIDGVKNYCIAVKEQGDEIIFLRRIVRGGADRSYGIQVARMAGVPDAVIRRAREVAEELAAADISVKAKEVAQLRSSGHRGIPRPDEVDMTQLSLFDTVREDDIIAELTDADLSHMTPIDALNYLYGLQSRLKNRI